MTPTMRNIISNGSDSSTSQQRLDVASTRGSDQQTQAPSSLTSKEKNTIQALHEFYMKNKGKKKTEWTEHKDENGANAGWSCNLILNGGSVGDVALPEATYSGEAKSKKIAEMEASLKAWNNLIEGGFVAKSIQAVATTKIRSTPAWVLPSRRCPSNPIVFADISINGSNVGRVALEFYADVVPEAANAFASLFLPGLDGSCPKMSGRHFIRVVPKGLVQLEQIIENSGAINDQLEGNEAIEEMKDFDAGEGKTNETYNEEEEDEIKASSTLGHNRRFLLSYLPTHPKLPEPGSLCMTTYELPVLDRAHVVVGQVLRGFGALRELEQETALNRQGKPIHPCFISECGALPQDLDLNSWAPNCQKDNGTPLPLWPDDLDELPEDVCEAAIRIQMALELREEGNRAYKNGQYDRSRRFYSQGIRYLLRGNLRRPGDLNYMHKEIMEEEFKKCQLNRAASYLKLGEYKKAAGDCRFILSRYPEESKALYRLGQALVGSEQLEEGVQVLTLALSKSPNDSAVKGSLSKAKQELQKMKRKQGKSLAKLFASGELGMIRHDESKPKTIEEDNDDDDDDDDDHVFGLSPEVEAALEEFGSQQLPGHPPPLPKSVIQSFMKK